MSAVIYVKERLGYETRQKTMIFFFFIQTIYLLSEDNFDVCMHLHKLQLETFFSQGL